MKTLGDMLRNAREAKNLTQKDVSKKVGINNKTISNYENNVSMPDPNTLKVFADIYETSVDYILGRVDIHNPQQSNFDKKINPGLDTSGLPEEAIKQVVDYIELIKLKYNPDRKFKKRKNS